MSPDLSHERLSYEAPHLSEDGAPADPIMLMEEWMALAISRRDSTPTVDAGVPFEPTAMTLSTIADGPDGPRPEGRIVLLKSFDSRGFVFFTNYDSAKGHELAANPRASLLFYWHPLFRQVRIGGVIEKVAAQESDDYFMSRPHGHQLGAWASRQSAEVSGLAELEDDFAALQQRFGDDEVPRPPHWGGYRLVPERMEFWQGQPSRMHDRLLYTRVGEDWTRVRLAP